MRITIDPEDPEWEMIQDDYAGMEWEEIGACKEDNNNSLSALEMVGKGNRTDLQENASWSN